MKKGVIISTTPLAAVRFRCLPCKFTFDAPPEVIKDAPEIPHHPWSYLANCPHCGVACEEHASTRNLRHTVAKRHANMHGPVSEAGKAAVAANLPAVRTPEMTARTRFNAMQHGMYAKTARMFPARPGSAWCGGCDVDEGWCVMQPACTRNAELLLRWVVATESKDPALLREMMGEIHGQAHIIINMMMASIIGTGVEIRAPKYISTGEGGYRFVKDEDGNPVDEISAHPLLIRLTEMLSKLDITPAASGLSEKDQADEAKLTGFLQTDDGPAQNIEEYRRQNDQAMEALAKMLKGEDSS